MRWFGQRKTRTMKAASLKAQASLVVRVADQLNNSDLLLRLLICGGGLMGMMIAVEAWRAPFQYRLGDYAHSGVLAHIRFERIDSDKTERARQKVEDTVPPVFIHDAHELTELPERLRLDLLEVANVARLADLSAETRAAFGWTSISTTEATGDAAPDLERDWSRLKTIVGHRMGAESRVDAVVESFRELLKPLRDQGIMDPELAASRELRPEDLIQVALAETLDEPAYATVAETLLNEQLKPTGRIGRNWSNFALLTELQGTLERWILQRSSASLSFDEQETTKRVLNARRGVQPIKEVFKRGATIVPSGQHIGDDQLAVLRAQFDTAEQSVAGWERLLRAGAIGGLLLVLAVVNGYHLIRTAPKLIARAGRLTVYWAALVITVALGRALSFDPWRAEVIPLLCTVMVLAIAYDQVLAILSGFTLALILTLATGRGLDQFVVLMTAVAMSVVQLNQVSSRSKIIKVGFTTAVAYFVVSWGLEIVHSQQLSHVWTDTALLKLSLIEAFWCLTAGYLVAGSLPFIESIFGVVTDISLLELGDVSHPLLQELIRRAPGTYNHSVAVATISETAADAIGANGLLCRVGAYFHDVGKMLKPQYFVENMAPGAPSRHEHLAPAMSTLIIIGHVKDGADLARQHNLPQPLMDFIEQHHGTTLVEYFFHAATRQAEAQPDHRVDVEESAFRYPGPKPQTKEAAVMMLADAVEGASRALSDPAPKRIETLVHDLAMKRLLDGQYEECGLTLSELAIVEDSLTKSLIGIYHGRIKYPEQRSA